MTRYGEINQQLLTTIKEMDSMHWNITYKPRNINSAEIVPVILLGLEALLGVGCNLTAAIIYWQQKRGLFQNPGNVFTVKQLRKSHFIIYM